VVTGLSVISSGDGGGLGVSAVGPVVSPGGVSGAHSVGQMPSYWTPGLRVGAVGLPADVGGVGFSVAAGEPGLLSGASARVASVGVGLEGFAARVFAAAGSLAPSWSGQAAVAYQQLSSIVHAHFRAAGGTLRTAAAALARYSAELDRCQRDGMTTTREAERCLKELSAHNGKRQAAQNAATAARGALSAALAEGAIARAAGPAGVSAAADAGARAAQRALSSAEGDAHEAGTALQHAEDELMVWRARGRRAWEEAQTAADQVTGTLQGLTIAPPPLAGIPALVATAPFAIPAERCGSASGEGEEPGLPGDLIADPIPDVPPWTESFPGIEPRPGDGVNGYTIPEKLPRGEDLPANEPIPGGNTTTDPAPEPCARQLVNDKGMTSPGEIIDDPARSPARTQAM